VQTPVATSTEATPATAPQPAGERPPEARPAPQPAVEPRQEQQPQQEQQRQPAEQPVSQPANSQVADTSAPAEVGQAVPAATTEVQASSVDPVTSEAVGGLDWSAFGWDIAALGLLVTQTAVYAGRHGGATANDGLNKLATQLQLIALTGTGNIVRDGKVDPGRLDAMMKGAMQVRLDNMAAILEFDGNVYLSAMCSFLLAAGKGAGKNRAIEVSFPTYEKGPDGAQVRTGAAPREVKCSYEGLRSAFARMETPADRTAFVKQVAAALDVPHAALQKVLGIAKQYEDNKANIRRVRQGKIAELCGPGSTLPADAIAMFRGSLCVAMDRGNASPANLAHDARLAKLKGDVEKYSTAGSVHQAAQKEGQFLTWGILGSAGPNLMKVLSTAITEALLIAADFDTEAVREINRMVKLASNSAAVSGSLLSIAVGYAYHRNIALKNLHRQRDEQAEVPSTPHSGLLRQSDAAFGGMPNTDRLRRRVTNFTTLAAPRISTENLADIPPLPIEVKTRFWKDLMEQVTALSGKDLLQGFRARHGRLDPANEDDIKQMIRAELHDLLAEHAPTRSAAALPGPPGNRAL
jgi:hypothetical protein